jgi:putative membrane protein
LIAVFAIKHAVKETLLPADEQGGTSMMHWFGDYGYGMGSGFGWIFMILFWVVVILLIFAFVKLLSKRSPNETTGKSAEEILKERYAKGEISKEEYEQIKKDIRS